MRLLKTRHVITYEQVLWLSLPHCFERSKSLILAKKSTIMSSRGKLMILLSTNLTNEGNLQLNAAPRTNKSCVFEETSDTGLNYKRFSTIEGCTPFYNYSVTESDALEMIKCQAPDIEENMSTDRSGKSAEIQFENTESVTDNGESVSMELERRGENEQRAAEETQKDMTHLQTCECYIIKSCIWQIQYHTCQKIVMFISSESISLFRVFLEIDKLGVTAVYQRAVEWQVSQRSRNRSLAELNYLNYHHDCSLLHRYITSQCYRW